VPLVALDDLDIPAPVRLIKMDVEGAEPQVVEGARRLLRRDRPVILSEVHPVQLARASRFTAGDFLGLMRSLHYRAQTIDGHPIDRPPDAAMVSVVFLPT
jgi:hypothetical protein